jgi:ankyrin repeat protein
MRQSLAGHGCTVLYLATREGHGEVVTILLKAGADLNFVESFFGETALGVATRKGHNKVVEILKKHGAKELAVRP